MGRHRTFDELFAVDTDLQELDKDWEFAKNSSDVNDRIQFLLEVRKLIVCSIQAGNYYDYDDAHNVAAHYGLAQCDWSEYGCPKPYDVET